MLHILCDPKHIGDVMSSPGLWSRVKEDALEYSSGLDLNVDCGEEIEACFANDILAKLEGA